MITKFFITLRTAISKISGISHRFSILTVTSVLAMLAGVQSCNKIEPVTDFDGTFIDPRDSTEYPYVTIGTQTWMAENLKIRLKDTSGAWCYNAAEGNCDTYGRLYTWDKAMIACPAGWHLPSDADWKLLEIAAGMSAPDADSLGWRNTGNAGIGLKARKGWNSGGNGENIVRFSAIPSGIYERESYSFIGDIASFWTSSYTDESHAVGRALVYHAEGVYRWKYTKSSGFSVRCIRN
jgi:uncharacterized protein (TIGR02145 family)